jgi:hypothetical protein
MISEVIDTALVVVLLIAACYLGGFLIWWCNEREDL